MKILVCGMPRSMTTWAFNVLGELIASPQPQALWIEPASDEERLFASASGVVLGKCHHYSPVLERVADIVVYSYRDLRTAAVSALRKFGSTGSREQLEVWIQVERLWRERADLVLRYEAVEKDPAAGVRELASLLRSRAGDALVLSRDEPRVLLARVEDNFRRGEESAARTHDARTLVLPGHRTFQPPAQALPAAERALYERIGGEFKGWLEEHDYLPRTAGGEAAPPARSRDDAIGGYIAALMRESAAKEAEILRISGLYAAADAERRVAMNQPDTAEALKEAKRELEARQRVIEEQGRGLDAYRQTFAVLGIGIVPLNFIVLSVRGAYRRTFGKLAPRLGVLRQHPPRPIRLPAPCTQVPDPAPLISIVTPSYGQGVFIERTIRSVIEQGYPSLEYFVQDGGSRDGTVEILERYSDRITGWASEPDSGQSDAINRAFAKTTGPIMAWLNSDDVLFPGALCHVADFFARNPDVDVVYGHRVLIDENDQEIGRWLLPPHDDGVLSWADFVPQETLFWRRRIWNRVGGRIDESFRFAMDWDLLVRFREAGARFARLPRFLGGFRVHSEQKTSAGIAMTGFAEMDRIRERVLGHVPTRVEVRKAVARYLLRHTATDLGWRIRSHFGANA
jgi:hypothetical protein